MPGGGKGDVAGLAQAGDAQPGGGLADHLAGQLGEPRPVADPVGDGLVGRPAEPGQHRHQDEHQGVRRPPRRQIAQQQHDGDQGDETGQDQPPAPAGLALPDRVQLDPGVRVVAGGGVLAQLPVALLGARPPHGLDDQPAGAARGVDGRLAGVLRAAYRVEPGLIAGIPDVPAQHLPALVGVAPHRRHDRRQRLVTPLHDVGVHGAVLVGRVDRAAQLRRLHDVGLGVRLRPRPGHSSARPVRTSTVV
jgi:hypothetical protein